MKLYKTILIVITLLLISSLSICFAEVNPEKIHRYQVKGVIVTLPNAENPKAAFKIKHEAIPDYVDESGKAVGMNAMTMPFTLAPGLSLESLNINDKVEFIFESWWKPKPGDQIVHIRKLED